MSTVAMEPFSRTTQPHVARVRDHWQQASDSAVPNPPAPCSSDPVLLKHGSRGGIASPFPVQLDASMECTDSQQQVLFTVAQAEAHAAILKQHQGQLRCEQSLVLHADLSRCCQAVHSP